MKTKEFIITVIFTAISLLVYSFFPAKDNFQQVTAMLIFLVVLPFLFSRYFLQFNTLDSFKLGDSRNGLIYSAASFFICLLIFFAASYVFDFFDKYKVPVFITQNFKNFLLYEFFLVLPFVVVYEYFFRGFILRFLRSVIGKWSILAQAAVFAVLIVSSGGSMIQYLPYLIFSFFAGFIYLKSGSLIYSALTQFILILVLNAIVIQRVG